MHKMDAGTDPEAAQLWHQEMTRIIATPLQLNLEHPPLLRGRVPKSTGVVPLRTLDLNS